MFRIRFCRENAFKLAYLIDVLAQNEEAVESILQNNETLFKKMNDDEKRYVVQIVNKMRQDRENIDGLISANLKGWTLDRLMPVERSLLRMAVAEYAINPNKVVLINEIVRISKEYGNPESYKIINAVLDKVLQ